ncbi:MAG: D-glycerate dehydrogenase [Deltaproteobacteria bacterium]
MKVLVTGRLPEEIMSIIKSEHEVVAREEDRPMPREELLGSVADIEGLLCMITDRIDDELMERAPKLRMVANVAVGYDNIDLAAATARGIWVSNTPGVLTQATADLTWALILATARRVVEGDRRMREGKFKFFALLKFLGTQVSGKTLGIVGMGQIGKAVARRARGFDMPILYHQHHRLEDREETELNAKYVSFQELLAQADFLSLHVPLTEHTRHLIGRAELKSMKPTAYLINAARGPVVDEQALVEALQNEEIAGAGLDVYENEPAVTPELIELDNVVLQPHVGSATRETRTKMAALAAENLLAGLRGEVPPNCLNCV